MVMWATDTHYFKVRPAKIVGFLAAPRIPFSSGILSPNMHWSRCTAVDPVLSNKSFKIGIFQAQDVAGFSKVKNDPCACNKLHRWIVLRKISLPTLSRDKVPFPSGFSLVLVPLFMFCMMLKDPHGKPKCHSCFGLVASLHNFSKVRSFKMSCFSSTFPAAWAPQVVEPWSSYVYGRLMSNDLNPQRSL